MIYREKTCCFTGHRNIADKPAIARRILAAIDTLYGKGITDFISGMAAGFDILAARQVISFKENHGGVRLICAIPSRDQTVLWDEGSMIAYKSILDIADETVATGQWSMRDTMLRRDRFMVDNSSNVIAYLNKNSGGTFYTVNYARDQGLNIINLA